MSLPSTSPSVGLRSRSMTPPTPPRFLGIDVSAVRGLDLALLDETKNLVCLSWLPSASQLEACLLDFGENLVIGIDAPSGLAVSDGGRQAEQTLRSQRVQLYLTPKSFADAKPWMQVGFDIWDIVSRLGYLESRAFGGAAPCSVEVFPYLAYVCWSGTLRGAEVPEPWAKRLVNGHGFSLPPWAKKDHADAIAAALVAAAYADGTAMPFGDQTEGVIWGPTALPNLRTQRIQRPAGTPRVVSNAKHDPQACLCGCGRMTSGRPGVRFVQGHDAKYYAQLRQNSQAGHSTGQ